MNTTFPIKCEDTNEICNNYSDYLKSNHWNITKAKYYNSGHFKRHGLFPSACQCCGEKNLLELHHNTYERLGKEELKDLNAVCSDCHLLIHELKGKGYPVNTNFIELIKSSFKRTDNQEVKKNRKLTKSEIKRNSKRERVFIEKIKAGRSKFTNYMLDKGFTRKKKSKNKVKYIYGQLLNKENVIFDGTGFISK